MTLLLSILRMELEKMGGEQEQEAVKKLMEQKKGGIIIDPKSHILTSSGVCLKIK